MPNNRLSVFFDRKLRYSKSTSNISQDVTPQPPIEDAQRTKTQRPKSGAGFSVMYEYQFEKPLPPLPPLKPATYAARPAHQYRSSTTPTIHPPDELFLSMIRRRSANARLEDTLIESQTSYTHDSQLDQRVALASALPPTYFDLPPEYYSPEREDSSSAVPRHSASIVPMRVSNDTKAKEDQLFLQINQAITQYSTIQVTEPTPVSPRDASMLVSPLNDIDRVFLKRRAIRKQQEASARRV